MDTIEMPKTYKERLDDLEIGDSIPVTEKRTVWADAVTKMHRAGNKRFSIRMTENGETRVWRKKDKQPQEA